MTMDSDVMVVAGLFKLGVANDLERYRGDSLETKEPETLAWLDEVMKDGDTLYDVGANIGIYALYAAAKHPRSKIFCFEPFAKNYQRLMNNVQLNGFKQIRAYPLALSDGPGLTRFFSFDVREGASGGQVDQPVKEDGTPFEPADIQDVVTLSIDQWIAQFGAEPPNHIKIDVDGNEMKIIAGMKSTLADSRLKSLLIEMNPGTTDIAAAERTFAQFGFKPDERLNHLEVHSKNRRKEKGSFAPVNRIYTR